MQQTCSLPGTAAGDRTSRARARLAPTTSLRTAWALLFLIVLAVVLLIRIRLLDIPLERDEGEYAYAAQLLLDGVPPYRAAYNLKFPGTYAAYALIMSVFGQNTRAIHLGLLLVNLGAVVFIFLIGRRLMSLAAGFGAAASYALLSASPAVLGFAAHATHFVVLPVLAGLWLLVRSARPAALAVVLAGMLFGAGVLMKQPAVFFVLCGAICLAYRDARDGLPLTRIATRGGAFLAGAALPTLVMFLLLWRFGLFPKFWFWTVTYAREYAQLLPIEQAGRVFSAAMTKILASTWPIWALAVAGFIAAVCSKAQRRTAFVLAVFLGTAAMAVSVGLYFRPHYFVLALPAVALCVGAAIHWAVSRPTPLFRRAVVVLFAGSIAFVVFTERSFFFQLDPISACRSVYPANPFPETIAVADFLRTHTSATDTIAVLGSEPQISFYAQRRSATGYLYTYGLMEAQPHARAMQEEMIREIEAAQPKYLVFVGVPASWSVQRRSPRLIFDWIDSYTTRAYQVSGLVEMRSGGQTKSSYLPTPIGLSPETQEFIAIYERKSTTPD